MDDPPVEQQRNLDQATVDHFGKEWHAFSQTKGWASGALDEALNTYFEPLPDGVVNSGAVAGDFGAGSGRWATRIAPRVQHLFVLEPSPDAMSVARNNLAHLPNITYLAEPIGGPSMPSGQLDLAYSLGVIHHIPDPMQALREVRRALKPGGYFLGYLYYDLENRPAWYKAIWRASDRVRKHVSQLPTRRKRWVTDAAAALIYWPAARLARLLSWAGIPTSTIPLSQYANKSYYVMRNDALDRFGTPLEQRFSQAQIAEMLSQAGFDTESLVFSDREPFWRFSVRNGRSTA